MENYKPLIINGRIWAIYQIENDTLFLHMLNPHNLRRCILNEIEQDLIFLIGVTEEDDFNKTGFLNLSPSEVQAFCEKFPHK